MGKFSKHFGENADIEIDGDIYTLRPLTVDNLSDFFMAMKAFKGAKENATMSELLDGMDKEGLNALSNLISIVLEKSYPDEPVEERKAFGLKYMGILIGKIFEMNSQQSTSKQDAVSEIKRRQSENARKNSESTE